ncbi:MAG: MFS transporter [Desulfobulbus sp.]|jgi:predicted MFS family arabinose efflux permease|uniref:MFS transporter n=1 Tax=Desulfobulbus sp. TaxID=895 RepID=UPI002851E26C|nr:MFS transporter [Desulfobulbus sp.]MDR2549729.1 MFS transporter [Desulfobulbus sp.]
MVIKSAMDNDTVKEALQRPGLIVPVASEQASNVPAMTGSLVLLLATATGMTVASIYYAQPLLEAMRAALGLGVTGAGMVITISQFGYALGLALLVPLGDLCERRKLVVAMTAGIALGLAGMGCASGMVMLLLFSLVVGALSVVAQILVAFAADLAHEWERGRVVGTVMSGLLLGILLARTAAGLLAQLFGWRAVFWLAAAVLLGVAAMIFRALPVRRPTVRSGYGALLKSTLVLFRDEPVLRLRSWYGALAFGLFSILWTPLAFLLSQPPFNYPPGVIGLFGFAGVAGALAASAAGRLADRGAAGYTTGAAIVLLIVSWWPIGLASRSVALLLAGILFLDLGVQALHITNQSEIYRLRPEARSRLTSAYMACFFAGGVAGSSLSALVYSRAGWTGVCVLGVLPGCAAAGIWLRSRAVRRAGVKAGN